jgi:CRISPR-associated endonuclease Cas1
MAATKTVAQRPALRKSETQPRPDAPPAPGILKPRHGVVTLFGYGVGIRVERGHLVLEDGIGSERFRGRFPRVGHGIERLVTVSSDGNLSLAALRWLADQNVAFVMLERDGRVLATTGPVRSSDAKLRRAQALANESGAALEISRVLIEEKLAGQEAVCRDGIRDIATADRIGRLRVDLPKAETISAIRNLEALGAQDYWSAWQSVETTFPRKDMPRVPEHWRVFGTRRSPLTGCPRSAVNPANAMLNYLYALVEAEARLASAAMGLDPGLGFLHLDTATRDSLACDLMEPVRPVVDAFVLDWLNREPIRRDWLFEQRDGTCRLMADFTARLAETLPLWRGAVAPVAEFAAEVLWASQNGKTRKPALRLTHRRYHDAVGGKSRKPLERTIQPESLCRTCGKSIEPGKRYCQPCAKMRATEAVKEAAPSGWKATQSDRAQRFRAETQRRHEAAKKAWDPASHPKWLNEEAYRQRILPKLVNVSSANIANALSVTWAYASHIRKGEKLPHPRHWQTLAEISGATAPK